MTTITVNTPAKAAERNGAPLLTAAFARVLSWFHHHVDTLAEAQEFAARSQDAARVRRFAQEVMGEDPRFAADLFAAADRHERF